MLIETVLAIFIMTVAGMALLALVQKSAIAAYKTRQKINCANSAQTAFNRLQTIDYYKVFAVDSNSPSYGLVDNYAAWTAYPYMTTLNGIKATLRAQGFDRFTLSLVFMRRDLTDANANGLTSDLIAFSDSGAGVDLYDTNIKYYDQNADGDYNETYLSGGKTISEQPDTHLKMATLTIYNTAGKNSCTQTQIISLEGFEPKNLADSESLLTLEVSTPTNNAVLFSSATTAQAASRSLLLFNSYPASVAPLRADTVAGMLLAGVTNPLATVNFTVGAQTDSTVADALGNFSVYSTALITGLVEGGNKLQAQAVKSTLTSPLAYWDILYDKTSPGVSAHVPTGTTNTRAPYVAATLADVGLATTTTSGICPDVIAFKINGSTVNFSYDSGTGLVVWTDSTTQTAPVISTGVYTAYVEAGDYAGYRTTYTWTFTAAIIDPDNSAPAISNKSPIGTAGSDLPVISVRVQDNQSGIDPASIQMTLDGAVVVDSSNIGQSYDASTGDVSYTPGASFVSGSFHTIGISVNHFAANPADKVNSADSWTFTVP